MGKKSKNNALRRRLLARNEAENRRSILETYTQPIHPGDNLVEYKAFLGKFYRNIYQHKAEIQRVLRNPTIKQFYDQLVPHQVSYEDFWQRYFYRCDKQCIDRWEQEQTLKEEEHSSTSELLNDAANRSNGSIHYDDDDDEKSIASTRESQDKIEIEAESSKENIEVKLNDKNDIEETKQEEPAVVQQDNLTKELKVADHSPPLLEESEISDSSNRGGRREENSNQSLDTTTTNTTTPTTAMSHDQEAATTKRDWGNIVWAALAVVAVLGGVLTMVDPLLKNQGSFCDTLRGSDTLLVASSVWTPKYWKHQLHSAICPTKTIELALEEETDSQIKKQQKPWSVITDKIRWRRRRTQNYMINNNDVLKEEAVEIDDESSLQQDAMVSSSSTWWSSWKSDTEQLALAASGNDAASSSGVAPSMSFMDRLRRGRGWKSKSWGETDQGDLVLEEQEVQVTMEAIQTSSKTATKATISTSPNGISIATSSASQPAKAYTKTVITEVKKTTIYTPVN